jgi:hypothetical protein
MFQVTWEPYGCGESFGYVHSFLLNPKCLEESNLWQMQCPLICLWAVEYHCPHRVSTQFGVAQVHPPVHVDTSIELHG